MRFHSPALATLAAALLALLAGCVSNDTVQSHPVTEGGTVATAHRRAEVHTALASEYFARGNFNVALAETQLAIKDDPAYAQAYNMQGLVYMELREDVSARAAFDRALSLAPDNPELLNNFGWFLCTRDEFDRAVPMLQKAAGDALYPTPEKAYLSLGLCLRRQHKDEDAERYLRRAVTIQPNLIGGLYNLSVIEYERGRYKDAETYLTRYMRLVQAAPLEALVMGVKIARANKDQAVAQSYMMQLHRRYPDAPQVRGLESAR
ncbi:MAG TPA: type IV pilus biogenesis/stability protein PilW [Usitatibacter sp.]|jgi:type IV pilus assembly protein PilF|nr:type IV pilus biogenesis/stability protein PilW [Usitatibacter sp.]